MLAPKSYRQPTQLLLLEGPFGYSRQPCRKQGNVEAQLDGRIEFLFLFRQQIEQQCAESGVSEMFCNKSIARAPPAAAAGVRKQDKRARIGREAEQTMQFGCTYRDRDRIRRGP